MYIRCQCFQIYQETLPKAGTYCQDIYVNNCRNNRPRNAGKHGIKQTDTAITNNKKKIYLFYIYIFQDSQVFMQNPKSQCFP